MVRKLFSLFKRTEPNVFESVKKPLNSGIKRKLEDDDEDSEGESFLSKFDSKDNKLNSKKVKPSFKPSEEDEGSELETLKDPEDIEYILRISDKIPPSYFKDEDEKEIETSAVLMMTSPDGNQFAKRILNNRKKKSSGRTAF